ncbi:DUF3880 domain-containing protein [Paenibacillus sp. SI8]|uniref:glycosyltransferase family protein n=1 Tax=unclassified Paenibacillus TaxID=185978 RepID=UPI00346730E5
MIKKTKRTLHIVAKKSIEKKRAKTVRLDSVSEQLVMDKVLHVLKRMKTAEPVKRTNNSNPARVIYKQLRILLMSALSVDTDWLTEHIIKEGLRHQVKEVVSMPANQDLSDALSQLNPDLLLVLGSEEPIAAHHLRALETATVSKAIWLSDDVNVMETTKQTAALFDFVFTQNVDHIPQYEHAGCKNVSYLPFAADHTVFHPKHVDEAYQSDVLLIGDAKSIQSEQIQGILSIISNKKIFAAGNGWEAYDPILTIQSNAPLQEYYNGAGIILNWQPSQRQILEISACGAFQFVEEHPNVNRMMNPDEDVITFRTATDLCVKLEYYMNQADQRRIVATRALMGSKYDYSFSQMITKLLDAVFNT